MRLVVLPLTLEQANDFIDGWHRHHHPVLSHRFSIGCFAEGSLAGVCIVGRPVARKLDQYQIAEVTRLATDGTKNACSILYAAAARACRAMGYARIQTFTLDSEPGTSLRAAGWTLDGLSKGRTGWHSREGRRSDQPVCVKTRWTKEFRELQTIRFEKKSDAAQLSMFKGKG